MSGLTFKSQQANRSGKRKEPFCRLPLILLVGLIVCSATAADASFGLEGGEYRPAGSLAGDQMFPSIALRSGGGYLVWQDNTDGDGLAVRARLLSGQFSGLSEPVYVNTTTAGDQENAQVAALKSGGAIVVWQTGKRGAQQIAARLVNPDGTFSGGELQLSDGGGDHVSPALAVLSDGTIVVAWAATGVDDSMLAVESLRLNAQGVKLGGAVQVNEFTRYNQRTPAVAATLDGGFVVAWVSEQQSGNSSADIYARLFQADGASRTGEFRLNQAGGPAGSPAVIGTGEGFLAAWTQFELVDSEALWDVVTRPFTLAGTPSAATSPVNTYTRRNQLAPKLAAVGGDLLVVYSSDGADGSGRGIAGQFLTSAGQRTGEELALNSTARGNQLTPVVASDGSGRFVAAWASFTGVAKGVDLFAQRLARTELPLAAPTVPYVNGTTSSRLTITWPELSGLPVDHFLIYLDGIGIPVSTADNYFVFTGLAPASTHSARVAYVLKDGRKSPLSEAGTGRTWGEDANLDGLPDDWQAEHFGADSNAWPAVTDDSDNDGVSNRNEFFAGTAPTSSQSVLRTELTVSSQGGILNWNTRAGGLYQVQYSTDLKTWTDVGKARLATADKDAMPLTDVPANAYYRVNFLR